jgi:hypothetical protein
MSHYPDIERAEYLCNLRDIKVQGFEPVSVSLYRCIGGEVVGVWHQDWTDADADCGYLRNLHPNYDDAAALALSRILPTR